MTADPNQSRRVDLILQQLDALPTLSQVAAHVLELTSAEDSRAADVVHAIESDPALASRVLKLSRCTERVRGEIITTIDRAVVHLGFEAVRSAVLAVQVFDLFDHLAGEADEDRKSEGTKAQGYEGTQGRGAAPDGPLPTADSRQPEAPIFEREAFWHHTIAVSVLSEELAQFRHGGRANALRKHIQRGEALVGGLLHDLGLLALHVLLPRSIDRACRLAEANGVSIDQACLRIVGMTTQTAGKRLAERWRLPRAIGDVMWLHGQRYDSLPDLKHRPLIGVVTLADALARMHYITPVGHFGRYEHIHELAEELAIPDAVIRDAIARLPEQVQDRAAALGLNAPVSSELLMRSVIRANQSLGRLNSTMRQRAMLAVHQQKTLQAIIGFQESLAPGDSVIAVLEKVVRSAREYFSGGAGGFFAVLHQNKLDDPWQLIQFSNDGHELRSELITPPSGSTAVSDLADSMHVSMQVIAMLPWLTDYLGDASDVRQVRLLPLRSGWGVSAVLLHDRPIDGLEQQPHLEALCRTWAAAVAAGVQHEGARMLGEQLAESNRMLIETQDELTRNQALAALGEVVAGAAHEMNNPLTIISGRSQQLVERLRDPASRVMADQIVDQAHRLSDMISSLRSFSEPVEPRRRPIDFRRFCQDVLQPFLPGERDEYTIDLKMSDTTPEVYIDPDQIGCALSELVRNATESKGCRHIEVRVQIEPVDDRLKVQVRDDGAGMSERTLAHCFDPFFSAKTAGRQPGLGLSRARRFVEAHGGRISLENRPSGGAVATVWLSEWREERRDRRDAA